MDISSTAITLARQNLHHNIAIGLLPLSAKKQIRIVKGDIFDNKATIVAGDWDVVISNPPYISPQGFNKTTSRSVRNYEPKMALVPSSKNHTKSAKPHNNSAIEEEEDHKIGDSFYPQILNIAAQANAKIVLLEVADMDQATRVAQEGIIRISRHWPTKKFYCEIWRDWPIDDEQKNNQQQLLQSQLQNESMSRSGSRFDSESESESEIRVLDTKVKIKGEGNGRSVLFFF